MSQHVTKADLDAALATIAARFDGLEAGIKRDTQEQLAAVHGRFDQVQVQLDALQESVAVRQELRRLVAQLRTKGIQLDEAAIFMAPVGQE